MAKKSTRVKRTTAYRSRISSGGVKQLTKKQITEKVIPLALSIFKKYKLVLVPKSSTSTEYNIKTKIDAKANVGEFLIVHIADGRPYFTIYIHWFDLGDANIFCKDEDLKSAAWKKETKEEIANIIEHGVKFGKYNWKDYTHK